MNHDMTRRDAIGGMAAIGALGFAGSTASAAQPKVRQAHISPAAMGFDATTREYKLPDLPYAYDALEPVIDEQTMRIHHDKHHAGYVNGANNALKQLEAIRMGSRATPGSSSTGSDNSASTWAGTSTTRSSGRA